jgi:hypothetical protein
LISLVCLELNARALVSSWKVENLDDLNVGVVGVFIALTTKLDRWWRLLSHGAPDTVRCASHVTWPKGSDRWSSVLWARPDRPCRLSGVPPARALLLCARRRAFNALQSTVARELAVAPLSHRTVR